MGDNAHKFEGQVFRSVWRTHQKKHAATFSHGTTASQETQNHDDRTHSNQDIHSNIGVSARIPRAENLKIKKRLMTKKSLSLVFVFQQISIGYLVCAYPHSRTLRYLGNLNKQNPLPLRSLHSIKVLLI